MTGIIKGDPYRQTPNGAMVAEIVDWHARCVVNGLVNKEKEKSQEKNCKTKNGIEHSESDQNIIITKMKLTLSP